MKPTDEQIDILKSAKEMQQGDVLLVNALAGCAKTTTLKMIAEDNPNSKFLYLAFNKAIVTEAKNKFPSNIKISTFHGFAKGYVGRKDTKTINLDLIGKITGKNITNKKEYFEVFNIRKVYEHFSNSHRSLNELNILKEDIQKELEDDYARKPNINNKDFLIEQRIKEIEKLPEIHNYILNSNFTTFETDLKEFVETAKDKKFNYEYIVLDESQDISKLLAKFIISLVDSKRYKMVIVGDNNQKIYGFLGNLNLSEILKNGYKNRTTVKHLTKSFRFRSYSEIEKLSNKILNLRNEKIIGSREVLSKGDHEAYISRTTFPLLAMAIYQIKLNKDYFLYGGISNFNIDAIKDIFNLYIHMEKTKINIADFETQTVEKRIELLSKNRDRYEEFPKINTKSLKSFSSFLDLSNFATSRGITEDENNINIAIFIYSKQSDIKLISDHNEHLVDKFFKLIDKNSNEESKTILSTIHKTKGLEFEKVTILRSLSVVFDEEKGKWVTHETGNGHILGLEKVPIVSEREENLSNDKLSKYFDKFGNSDRNIFSSRNDKDNKLFFSEDFDDDEDEIILFKDSKISDELIINFRTSNIKEEYNILYVAITRAINEIKISNVHYLETLKFLEFVNKNLDELVKIVNGKESNFLEEITIKQKKMREIKTLSGVVYNKSFLSVNTLKEFLPQI